MNEFLDTDFTLPFESYASLFAATEQVDQPQATYAAPSTLFGEPESIYSTPASSYTSTSSLAALFEQHTAHLVTGKDATSQSQVPSERPRHKRRQSSTSSLPYSRPPSTTPRNVSQTPADLAAAGIPWEPWMAKDAPKTRRILNALLNPHAFTRSADQCVQCAMDGVPCMLDIGVAAHEGIPCASCRGVRCTFKTQARRGGSAEPQAKGATMSTTAPTDSEANPLAHLRSLSLSHPPSRMSTPPPAPSTYTASETDSVVTPPTRCTSPDNCLTARPEQPSGPYPSAPKSTPAPQAPQSFLSPLPGVSVSSAIPSLYLPQQPCVGCHASAQPCIITTSETRNGAVPACGCCSAAGLECLFVFAQDGWAHLSQPVLVNGQATWVEGCASFPL